MAMPRPDRAAVVFNARIPSRMAGSSVCRSTSMCGLGCSSTAS